MKCVNVKIQKVGFLKYEQIYCNKKEEPPPKQQYFELKRDDAEEASIKTDQANVDFSVLKSIKSMTFQKHGN